MTITGEPSEAATFEYLGIRATGGPLLDTPLPLRPGLTVLYGLNGAGKTRLLTALYSALLGEAKALDDTDLPEALDVSLFVRSPLLATQVTFDPPFDDLTELFAFPGDPYRPEDLADIVATYEQGVDSEVVAASPDPRPGMGWIVRKAIEITQGTPADRLRQRDNAFLEVARHQIAGDDLAVRRLCRTWVFEEDTELSARIDGAAFLHLRAYDGPAGLAIDQFADVPDDGLPIVLTLPSLEGWGTRRPRPVEWGVGADVITNTSVDSLREATVAALIDGMSGLLLIQEDGWAEVEDVRAADALRYYSVDMISRMQQEIPDFDWRSGVPLPFIEAVRSWLARVAALADRILQALLLDAPKVAVTVTDNPFDVLRGTSLRWHTQEGLPLTALSNAQRRWAVLSIRLALMASARHGGQLPSTPFSTDELPIPSVDDLHLPEATFLILDEPESALHRAAEAHMAAGLERLARTSGLHLVVATHSPEVLNLTSARVHRVHRTERVVFAGPNPHQAEPATLNVTQVTPLDEVARADLEQLGLSPADLLRRQRAFLLVEGEHDLQVLQHLLGPDLQRFRVQILPLRGASQLPAALESRLLFDYTDALIIPIVDNVGRERISGIWEEALTLAATQGPDLAGQFLRGQLDPREAIENKFLAQFLSRAIELGVQSRVEPFGFVRKDILFYLPVEAFTNKAASWQDILDLHHRALATGATRMTDWKAWASQVLGAQFDRTTIASALESLTEVPAEFELLRTICASTGVDPG